MKRITKAGIAAAFILAMIISFFAGNYLKEREYADKRVQYCNTLLSFAVDKAENEDLSDQNVMKALISNVYAAYGYCDKPDLSSQLHDLWNMLIFEGDSYIGREEELVTQLKNIAKYSRNAANRRIMLVKKEAHRALPVYDPNSITVGQLWRTFTAFSLILSLTRSTKRAVPGLGEMQL